MAHNTIELDAQKLLSNCTLEIIIKQKPSFRLRLWLARFIFYIAGKVLGSKVEWEYKYE